MQIKKRGDKQSLIKLVKFDKKIGASGFVHVHFKNMVEMLTLLKISDRYNYQQAIGSVVTLNQQGANSLKVEINSKFTVQGIIEKEGEILYTLTFPNTQGLTTSISPCFIKSFSPIFQKKVKL